MGRRRIGDGPSAVLMGRFLNVLLAHVEQNGNGDRTIGITADDLAQRLGVSAGETRVMASELARSGGIRIGRMSNGRAHNGGRYAQSVALPAPGAQRGVTRQPRMRPVGLLIEADAADAEQLGRMLREESIVPIAVPTTGSALLLLKAWGFELVMLDCDTRQHPLSATELTQIQQAIREAACGPLLLLGGASDLRRVTDLTMNGASRIRVVSHDREQVRTAVAEVQRGAMSPLMLGATSLFG